MKTFLSARWENLIMANYAVDPEMLKPYLPYGVELDMYKHKAYVSLVGFMFKKTSLFQIPIPLLGTFEEINLRFYVKRMDGDTLKRGVVFINETVPYKMVAWLANKLYKEHYTVIPTKNLINTTGATNQVQFEWKTNQKWNQLFVRTEKERKPMLEGSVEEFIFEHYYGYTKVDQYITEEYKVNHPRWWVNQVLSHSIDCDFAAMYGQDFSFLASQAPDSVIFAEGSAVTIDWKRNKI